MRGETETLQNLKPIKFNSSERRVQESKKKCFTHSDLSDVTSETYRTIANKMAGCIAKDLDNIEVNNENGTI